MEEALLRLGLSPKEATLYLLLLEKGDMTAGALAEASGEKRTNVYALLTAMTEKGITTTGDGTVRTFGVTDPVSLQNLLQAQQDSYRQAAALLQTALPQIRSQYSLTTDKPGVVHMAGMSGFQRLLDDMTRSTTEILLVASNDTPADAAELLDFRKRLLARKEAGVPTRAILHADSLRERHRHDFAERGMDLRFLGEKEFKGEMAVYEDNVAFTVYNPSLVVTILTNRYIAETMRTLFEELWRKAT